MRRSSVVLSLLTAILTSEASHTAPVFQKPISSTPVVTLEPTQLEEDEQHRIMRESQIKLGKELSD